MNQQQEQLMIKQIEQSCEDLQSANSKARENAEKVIIEFTRMQSPYQFCFSLLKQSQSTWAHFYALSAVRDAVIREWSAIDKNNKWSIVETLMHYILSTFSMTNATKNQSYNTMAVLCKRAWLDEETYADGKKIGEIVVDHMNTQLFSSDRKLQEVAIGVLSSIVVEFSSSSKSSQTQQTWEYHQRAMLTFQQNQLQPLFRNIVSVLVQFKQDVVSHNHVDERFIYMLYHGLQLFQNICDWHFLDQNYVSLSFLITFKSSQYQFRPSMEWSSVLTESNVVFDLVFQLYPLVKTHKEISHVLRVIMTRLACLNGPLIKQTNTCQSYLCNLIDRLSPLLTAAIQQQQQQNNNQSWNELEDMSNLLQRLCSNFKFDSFQLIPLEISKSFFENLTKYILSSLECMKLTITSGDADLENELENEFFSLLIRAWVGLLSDIESIVNSRKSVKHENFNYLVGIIKVCSEQIYNNYIKTRIELSLIELNSDDSVTDNELEEDKNKYNEQLKLISYIGRVSPGSSMEILKKEINQTVDQLVNSGDHRAFETLHWLILLAGHLLFDSETTLSAIPNMIEKYTYEQDQNGAPTDAVIDLSNSIFRYALEFELKALLHYKNIDRLSPLIAETCMWFLSGWALVYLYPSTEMNITLSRKIVDAYGSDKVAELVNLLVLKINLNLRYWQGEFNVLSESANLLRSMCINKPILKYVVSSQHWKELFQLEGGIDKLNPKIQGRIFSSFTRVVYSAPLEEKVVYFNQLSRPLSNVLDTLFQRPDFQSIANNPEVKETLFTLLYRLNGIISIPDQKDVFDTDAKPQYLAFDLFYKYAPALISLIPIYSHHHDIVNLILKTFSHFTKYQLETVDETRSQKIFPILVDLFNTISKLSSNSKVNLENKEQYARIKMMIRIINNIVLFNDVQNDYPKIIVQAVLHGICVTVPCITSNGLLEYPELATSFFSIIYFLFSSDDIDLSAFPSHIFNTLLSLVEYGITHHNTDISSDSLNSILSLARNIKRMLSKSIPVDLSITTQLLGSMINFFILHDFNMDELLYNSSNAFFELVSLNPEGFKTKANQMIQLQDPSLHEKFSQNFEALMISINQHKINNNRDSRDNFDSNIKKFISNVKPLLKKK